MKRLFYLLAIMFVASTTYGQVKFKDISLEAALNEARQNEKYLFVSCYSSINADISRRFSSTIYNNKDVAELMNDKFVNIRLDIDKGDGPFFHREYNIIVSPTFIILDSDGKEISRSVSVAGYNPARFKAILENMLSNSMAEAREKFKHSIEGAHEYILSLNNNYLITERDKALVSLFARRSDVENYKKENFEFYNMFINNIFHPLAVNIMGDNAAAVMHLGKKRYGEFVKDKLNRTINEYIIYGNLNSEKIRELTRMAKQHKDMKGGLLKFFEDIAPYLDNDNLKEITKYSTKRMKRLSSDEKGYVIRYIISVAKEQDNLYDVAQLFELLHNQSKDKVEKEQYKRAIEHLEKIM